MGRCLCMQLAEVLWSSSRLGEEYQLQEMHHSNLPSHVCHRPADSGIGGAPNPVPLRWQGRRLLLVHAHAWTQSLFSFSFFERDSALSDSFLERTNMSQMDFFCKV